MTQLRTIILAAGKGTRMKSELSKVLHPVCGQPMLQFVLDAVKSAGSLKTYVVVGHQAKAVIKYLGKDNQTVLQKRLAGTADAVNSVRSQLRNYRGDVLIVCGDTPLLTSQTLRAIVSKHRRTKATCSMLTALVENPSGYGRMIRTERGKIYAIREHKDASAVEKNIREINVGVYCVKSAELFKALSKVRMNTRKKEFYLTDILEIFSREKKTIESVTTQNPFEGLGINNRIELATASREIRQRILERLMLDGVTIEDPNTTYVQAGVRIGRDSVIKACSVIERGVIIGKKCLIGPFARLRPGTRIADGVEIGNFGEVSRSTIGSGTLMKHFGFLGDARVGAKVNIGAGTITANYDGKNKNQTIIADQAFIGSDVVLVAPVKIGRGAMVGAGSVVTRGKNVPPGKVAVGAPAQIIRRLSS